MFKTITLFNRIIYVLIIFLTELKRNNMIDFVLARLVMNITRPVESSLS